MASPERLLVLPEMEVVNTRLTPSPNAAVAVSEAANDATYRTTLLRGGVVADALSMAGRALGALTLIFTPGNTGPDRTGELNEPLRTDSPAPGPTDSPTVDPRSSPDIVELPSVDIVMFPGTPSYAPGMPSPGVFPSPFGLPFDLPYGIPSTVPLPSGAPRPAARPSLRPTTDPDTGIKADPLNDPLAAPRPNIEPLPRANPKPESRPTLDPLALPFDPLLPNRNFDARPVPGDVTNDLIDKVLAGNPEPDAAPEPAPNPDKCNCEGGGKKKKKKKKDKPPRAVCWQGTYTQRARGISYARRKQVPCTQASLPGYSSPKSRTPKSRTPKWQDVLEDVFRKP